MTDTRKQHYETIDEETYCSLIELRDFLKEKFLFFSQRKNNTTKIVEKISILFNSIEQKLHSECIHDYVDDYIDITPEKSQKITYCKSCWCTFP
jgi:hypothetical protein